MVTHFNSKEMKTKEAILQACGEERYGVSQYDGFKTDYTKGRDAAFILKAMEDYSKQVAIAFAEWISGVYSKEYNGWKHYRSGDIFTQEELFDLFLTEQSTVKK